MVNQTVSEKLRFSYVFQRVMTFLLEDGTATTGTVIRYDNDIFDVKDALTGTSRFYTVSSIVGVTDPYF